jgi:hypothetical protein
MIKDTKIDLTIDHKFGGAPELLIPQVVRKVTRFPWNVRRIETHEQLMSHGRLNRLHGDVLSDEMGFMIRRCSDGKWFFGDKTHLKKYYFWNMFEEVLLELGIGKTSFNACPKCGKKMITPRTFTICEDCQLERHIEQVKTDLFPKIENRSFVTWRDSVNVAYWDKNGQQQTQREIPVKDLIALRKIV